MRPSAFSTAIAIVLGSAAWALHRGSAELVPPAACAGALDALSAVAARLAPNAPLGLWLLRANVLLLGAAVALTVLLLQRCCGSWLIAASVGIAIVVQPLLDPVLSPFDPAVVLLASAAFLALQSGAHKTALATIAVTALMTPRAAFLLVPLAVWHQWKSDRRSGQANAWSRPILAAAIVAVSALALLGVAPATPPYFEAAVRSSCVLPVPLGAARDTWLDGARAILGSAGPYAIALAVLGAFSVASRRSAASSGLGGATAWILLSYALLPTLGAQPGQSVVRNFGPLLVAYWVCIAAGLDTIVRACRPGAGGRIAAAAFIVLLPLFPILSASTRPSVPQTFGLERVSLNALRHLLAVMPDGSVLVDEDATVTTLLRGLHGSWEGMGKRLELAEPDPEVLSRIPPTAHVFVLPRSQTALQWLGIRLTDATLPGVSGMAELRAGAPCQRVKTRWLDVPSVPESAATSFSVLRDEIQGEHAVVVYAITSAEPRPTVLGAADSDRTGVTFDVYSLVNESDRARLEAIAREDQLPREISGLPLFAARLEFWRAAAQPAMTAVSLGVPARDVLVRATSGSATDVVCPAFPYSARDLQIWQ